MKHAAAIVVVVALGGLPAGPAQARSFAGPHFGVEVGFEDYKGTEGQTLHVVGGWDFAPAPEWILGAGARIALDGMEDGQTQRLGANTATARVAIEDQRGLAARFGRVFGERTLVFAEAGHEWFHVDAVRELRAPVCAPPSGCLISRLDGSFDETMFSVGGGVEWAVTDGWRLRGTYAYGDSDAFERNRFALSAAYSF